MIKLKINHIIWSLMFLIMLSCSTTKHHKTLSIFFDGVPDQEQKKAVQADSTKSINPIEIPKPSSEGVVIASVVAIHPDYKNKSCGKCHSVDHAYRLNQRQPQLCYNCHEPFESKFKILHGPVAAGFLFCLSRTT